MAARSCLGLLQALIRHHISQRHPPAWPHPSKCCAWFGKPFGAQSIKLRTLADVMAPALGRDGGNALKGGQGATPAIRSIHGLDARRLHRLTLPKGTLTLTARIARDTRATLACLASHAAAHQSTPGPWCRGGVGWLLLHLRIYKYAAVGQIPNAAHT